jgi:hypothetical protein
MLETSENFSPSAIIPSGFKRLCNPVINSDVVEAVLARQRTRQSSEPKVEAKAMQFIKSAPHQIHNKVNVDCSDEV